MSFLLVTHHLRQLHRERHTRGYAGYLIMHACYLYHCVAVLTFSVCVYHLIQVDLKFPSHVSEGARDLVTKVSCAPHSETLIYHFLKTLLLIFLPLSLTVATEAALPENPPAGGHQAPVGGSKC